MKTIKEIVKEIASREGLKKEVSVGNIREIVGIISDLLYQGCGKENTYGCLYSNGKRRAKKLKV